MKSANYSVNSAFSAAFRMVFRRQLPGALIAAVVCSVISVIYALFYCTGYYGEGNDISYGVRMWGFAVIFVASVYCAVSVGVMFNAYFTRRSCDYHFAMPYKRSHIYNANFLFGLMAIAFMIAVSATVFAVTTGIISVSGNQGSVTFTISTVEVLKPLLTVLASLLAGYSACVMCASVSGKWLQYAALLFICIFSVPVLLIGIASRINYIWGVIVSLFDFSSITPFGVVSMMLMEPSDGMYVFMSSVALVEFAGMYVAGLLSFKHRKAEIAESGQGGSAVKYLLMALFVASGFLYFSVSRNLLITIVTGVITAFICAVLFSSVQVRRKKIFTKPTGILFAVVTCLCVVFTVSVYFSNSLSYVKYVPKAQDVESVTVTEYGFQETYNNVSLSYIMEILDGSNSVYRQTTLSEPENINAVIDFHTSAVSDEVINYVPDTDENDENIDADYSTDEETTAVLSSNSVSDSAVIEEDDPIGGAINCSIEYKLKNGLTVYRAYSIEYDLWHQFIAIFKNKEAVMQQDGFSEDINDVMCVEVSVYQNLSDDLNQTYADQGLISYVLPADKWENIRGVLAEERLNEEDSVFYYESSTGASLTVYYINPNLSEDQKEWIRSMTPEERYNYVSYQWSDSFADYNDYGMEPILSRGVYVTVQDKSTMNMLMSKEIRDSAIYTFDMSE